MKAPKYFFENRYASILVPTEESDYEIDNAEITFERKISREQVAANRLLCNNEFSKAIDKYLHLRATITTFLRPQLSVAAAHELTWPRETYRAVTESLIDRSAHLLRATPVTRTSMPDAFVAHPPKLPDTLTRALKPVEQFGLSHSRV